MSHLPRRLTLVGLLLAALLGIVVTGATPAPPPPREIRVEARGMAFYLAADPRPNPPLRLRRGERIRLVLRNADAGIVHDLRADVLGAATRQLEAAGQTAVFDSTVPPRSGRYEYVCSLHPRMMRGDLVIE